MAKPKKKWSKVKKVTLVVEVLAIVVLAALIAVLLGAGNGGEKLAASVPPVAADPVATEEPAEPAYIGYETPYLTLRYPSALSVEVTCEQETEGAASSHVFYMVSGETKMPLYRVKFGDAEAGEWLGVLQTAEGDVPVTYTVFVLGAEDLAFLGEGAEAAYAELMNAFSIVLDSVYGDSRYLPDRTVEVGEEQTAEMTYWTITLPGKMHWAESTEGGAYLATFFGEVRGERIALYRVRIGGEPLQTVLGKYKINSVDHVVSLESSDLSQYTDWTDEERSAVYQMMETINIVIERITSSGQFTADGE